MTADPHVQSFFHAGTGTWTYVVHAGRDAVVIDPVLDYDHRSGHVHTRSAREVLDYVVNSDLQVHHILETHAHADHLTAAAFVRASINVPVAIGAGIRSVQDHFSVVFGMDRDDPMLTGAFDRLLVDGEVFTAGALSIEVMATPGHTGDSLSYRIGANVFVGDTLYAESEVLEKRESKSRPGAGIVTCKSDGFNQDGKLVCTFNRTMLIARQGHSVEDKVNY